MDIYDETNRNPAEDDSGFTGKDWDADVELYYFNARWYDSEIGRFISQDPAEDDPTLYIYGFNNPMKFVDPSGYWNVSVNWSSVLSTSISYISPETGQLLGAFSTFRGFVGTISNIQWANFLESYTGMNEKGFKAYLEEKGINYQFTENNTSSYVFKNTEGQQALKQSQFGHFLQKALVGDQKLSYFHAMEGNIEAFLENNPGLSLEQVKGVFDSAVISADHDWGFGKNEFRYEGRGSDYAGLYDAEAVVMNEGIVLGVFTRASTEADNPSLSIGAGIFDYEVGYHHMTRYTNETKGIERLYTDIYQKPPLYYDSESWYTYGNTNNPIDTWYKGTYPALRIQVPGRTGIVSHAGVKRSRGSDGCPTMWQDDYLDYMNLFNKGEKGKFIVVK